MDYKKMEKVNEIIQLCLEINGFEKRQIEITGNKPAVFFDFSGHTAGLYVRVFETGWEAEKDADKIFYIYLDDSFEDLEIDSLDSCIQYLKSLREGVNNEYLQQAV